MEIIAAGGNTHGDRTGGLSLGQRDNVGAFVDKRTEPVMREESGPGTC